MRVVKIERIWLQKGGWNRVAKYIGPVEEKLCNQKRHVEEILVPGRKNSQMKMISPIFGGWPVLGECYLRI